MQYIAVSNSGPCCSLSLYWYVTSSPCAIAIRSRSCRVRCLRSRGCPSPIRRLWSRGRPSPVCCLRARRNPASISYLWRRRGPSIHGARSRTLTSTLIHVVRSRARPTRRASKLRHRISLRLPIVCPAFNGARHWSTVWIIIPCSC